MATLKKKHRRSRVGPSEDAAGERAARAFRCWLDDHDLRDHRIYFVQDGIADLDSHLSALAPEARWESAPGLCGAKPAYLSVDWRSGSACAHETGILRLREFGVIVARTFYYDGGMRDWQSVWLFAVRAPADFVRLRAELVKCRNKRGRGIWQQLGGDEERLPRGDVRFDQLVLDANVRARLEAEVLPFFTPGFAKACDTLALPYRRGVLFHGPPGNGKTTLLRAIACAYPEVPAFVLRPSAYFDDDDLAAAIKRWSSQAPALLAIEDLDWLLPKVNVSNFLNMLDGIDRPGSGLLLLATTNHPEALDPAINNRPGRFDVVIEVPLPAQGMRREYLARLLPDMDAQTLGVAAAKTDRLSFAHLREIVHRAGLRALGDHRTSRTAEDLLTAVIAVAASNHKAAAGFVPAPSVPFGLAQFTQTKRGNGPRAATSG